MLDEHAEHVSIRLTPDAWEAYMGTVMLQRRCIFIDVDDCQGEGPKDTKTCECKNGKAEKAEERKSWWGRLFTR